MKKESRTKNTKRNLSSGIINKIISLIFPFIIRTCILYYLSERYLGLSSLFGSILQVLNLAELGFSSAIVYNMYKPIADCDYELVGKYLNYYKKIYIIVGSTIFIVGIFILPFITLLINGSWPKEINIYLLYLLYLFDSSISYFLFAYKSSLLIALQKLNVVNNIQTIIWFIKYLLQIISIVIFKNYYIFVSISIFSTIAINITTAIYVNKNYSIYKSKNDINKGQKCEIKKQVWGLMISKLGDVSRNSFDSIILSAFFGLTTVAIYNNYYYIFSAIYAIMLIITSSMQASVGNSIVKESIEKNYYDLLKFNYIFCYIICFCCISLISLYQPFMKIWVGNEKLMSNFNMILLCLYFWILNINNARNLYFTGNGLWWKAKLSFVLEALSNLVLNIILGKIMGITGIIIATIITILVFNYIIRTNILFKTYFKKKPFVLYKNTFIYFIITLLLCAISYIICNFIVINGILGLIIYFIIALMLSMLFNVFFAKTNEFKNSLNLIKTIIGKKE